jgi:hypothetical protein
MTALILQEKGKRTNGLKWQHEMMMGQNKKSSNEA